MAALEPVIKSRAQIYSILYRPWVPATAMQIPARPTPRVNIWSMDRFSSELNAEVEEIHRLFTTLPEDLIEEQQTKLGALIGKSPWFVSTVRAYHVNISSSPADCRSLVHETRRRHALPTHPSHSWLSAKVGRRGRHAYRQNRLDRLCCNGKGSGSPGVVREQDRNILFEYSVQSRLRKGSSRLYAPQVAAQCK